jgi:hypothetical protein
MNKLHKLILALLVSCSAAYGAQIKISGLTQTLTAPTNTLFIVTVVAGGATNSYSMALETLIRAGITNSSTLAWYTDGGKLYGYPTNVTSGQIVTLDGSKIVGTIGESQMPAIVTFATDWDTLEEIEDNIGGGIDITTRAKINSQAAFEAYVGWLLPPGSASVGDDVYINGGDIANPDFDDATYIKFVVTGTNVTAYATNLVNANIASAAAIERAKIAAGTAAHIVINDGSGNFSSEATLGAARFPTLTGDIATSGLTATIQANSVALGTDTTGNYALGDAEGGAATTGDSATSFFPSGTIEDARLPSSMANKAFTGTFTVPANTITLATDTVGNYAAGDGEAGNALTGDSALDFFSSGLINPERLGTGTPNSSKVLYGDGTWAAVSGTAPVGTVVNTGTPVQYEIPFYLDTTGTNIGPTGVSISADGETLSVPGGVIAGTTDGYISMPDTDGDKVLGYQPHATMTTNIWIREDVAPRPGIVYRTLTGTNISQLATNTLAGLETILGVDIIDDSEMAAGSQTPWVSVIDGGGYGATNVAYIEYTSTNVNETLPFSFFATNDTSYVTLRANPNISTNHNVWLTTKGYDSIMKIVPVDASGTNYMWTNAVAATDYVAPTGIDTSAEVRTLLTDEEGTGALFFVGGNLAASTATTATAGDNDTSVATTAFVGTAVNATRTGSHTTPSVANPLAPTWSGPMHTVYYGATGEIDLPAAAGYDGKGIEIYNTGAFTITIDPNSSEVIVRDGTVQTGGVSFTLSSGAGNYVFLMSDGTRWITKGYKGTLTVGS